MAIINCYDVNGNAIRFLTQWDHDISIRATGVKTSPIPEFRFSNKHSQKSKCISGVVVGDGVKATIPNGFLQEALPIYVQLFYTYPSGDAKTEHTFVIPVKPASMPDGAVYEPVEVRSIVELEKRVKALEKNGVPGAGGIPSDPSFDTVSLGGDAGVVIIPEGTADAPAITFYGARGDEPVALNNVADATDDRSATNLGQVKQLVKEHSGQGGSGGAGLGEEEKTILLTLLRNAHYDINPDTLITRLEEIWGSNGGGGEESGTEVLDGVFYAKAWPTIVDGAWTFANTSDTVQSSLSYIVMRPGEILGGKLTIAYNAEECDGFQFSVRTMDAVGNAAHCSTGDPSVGGINWVVAGEDAVTGTISCSPTEIAMPAAEKPYVIFRNNGSTGTIYDGLTTTSSKTEAFLHWATANLRCTVSKN